MHVDVGEMPLMVVPVIGGVKMVVDLVVVVVVEDDLIADVGRVQQCAVRRDLCGTESR